MVLDMGSVMALQLSSSGFGFYLVLELNSSYRDDHFISRPPEYSFYLEYGEPTGKS